MRAKRIGIILISLLLIADISGCENLKKKKMASGGKDGGERSLSWI